MSGDPFDDIRSMPQLVRPCFTVVRTSSLDVGLRVRNRVYKSTVIKREGKAAACDEVIVNLKDVGYEFFRVLILSVFVRGVGIFVHVIRSRNPLNAFLAWGFPLLSSVLFKLIKSVVQFRLYRF